MSPVSIEKMEEEGTPVNQSKETVKDRIKSLFEEEEALMTQGEVAEALDIKGPHANTELRGLCDNGDFVRGRVENDEGKNLIHYGKKDWFDNPEEFQMDEETDSEGTEEADESEDEVDLDDLAE